MLAQSLKQKMIALGHKHLEMKMIMMKINEVRQVQTTIKNFLLRLLLLLMLSAGHENQTDRIYLSIIISLFTYTTDCTFY